MQSEESNQINVLFIKALNGEGFTIDIALSHFQFFICGITLLSFSVLSFYKLLFNLTSFFSDEIVKSIFHPFPDVLEF